MIFVGKNNRQIVYTILLLTLIVAFLFAGSADASEINSDLNALENEYNDVGVASENGEQEKKSDENEINQDENIGSYHTQNVYFTEDAQRYVVVYSNNTYVSLVRNENAENKSEDVVCQFL
ncbi:hypothetical protein MmiEs2_04090 [Methanimicrococcus stummii]|uniref:Uncharacterized protein n=1 Tax=Methanimicrococcus stummii TaxID=3028294 RepID=A0AA96V9J5_9EURY|nr:hypothetical protein [Methanimicrococcus sp. Es2]WNY28225.1 hypothetical protein MmiEs2_04090 [Methanimicrococcus sp. Es2]